MFKDFAELGEKGYDDDDRAWDEFVRAHPHGSILQTTGWARLKNRFGWKGYRVWAKKDDKLVAGAQILFKSAAMRMLRIGYIPHGPLVDWSDKEQVDVMINQIDWAVYEHRAGLVKFEPLVWETEADDWEQAVKTYGLEKTGEAIQPPRTMVVDITPSEEEILAGMKSKTRYNIRLSAKKGVVVREGAAQDIPAFAKMMAVTGQRNEFGVHAPEYYGAAYEIFRPLGDCVLLLAEFEGKPLAGAMIFKCGKMASYLYGASNNEERNRMPTYAVQWAAIQWAKAQGCEKYDLWGVPDAERDQLEAEFKERNDGLWGVYRFKRGFDGDIVRRVDSAERIYNNLVYRLYKRRRNL